MPHLDVDWKMAPAGARWWAMDANGGAYWHCEPDVAWLTDFWFAMPTPAPTFGYKGGFRESLTERPAETEQTDRA